MPLPTPGLIETLAEAAVRWLARAVAPHLPPRRPRAVAAILIRQEGPMLIYKPILPAPGAPDVATRELTVVIDGGDPFVLEADDSTEIGVEDGQVVTLTLVDVDDAGNRSEPSAPLTFTASDTIAPPAPGELSVQLVREEA